MYGIQISAAKLDWQIATLKLFPQIVNKNFRPVMNSANKNLMSAVSPNIPRDTLTSVNQFEGKVSGNGLNLKLRVGWWKPDTNWYLIFPEVGAKPHKFGKGTHPGTPAKHFMKNAFEKTKPAIEQAMTAALGNTIRDLEIK